MSNQTEPKTERLGDILLDIKMSATNALAEMWLSEPEEYTDKQRYDLLVEAIKIIQKRAMDAIERHKSA
jgi:hypothetical protein